MEYQVQIYVSEVGEWYGWAHSPYDATSRPDAMRAARIARQYGWRARVRCVRAA